MGKRRSLSLRERAKSQLAQVSHASGQPDGLEGLSPADVRAVLRGRTERNFLPLEREIERDLFGSPVEPPGRRGRPRHLPTADTRARVLALRKQGRSILLIAAALRISHPTLMKNYPVELRSTSQTWRQRAAENEKEKTDEK